MVKQAYFDKGGYAALGFERDFHYVERNVPVAQETNVEARALDADFFDSHFYMNGNALRLGLGYQWPVMADLNLSLEAWAF